jgi:hypothetical protein
LIDILYLLIGIKGNSKIKNHNSRLIWCEGNLTISSSTGVGKKSASGRRKPKNSLSLTLKVKNELIWTWRTKKTDYCWANFFIFIQRHLRVDNTTGRKTGHLAVIASLFSKNLTIKTKQAIWLKWKHFKSKNTYCWCGDFSERGKQTIINCLK